MLAPLSTPVADDGGLYLLASLLRTALSSRLLHQQCKDSCPARPSIRADVSARRTHEPLSAREARRSIEGGRVQLPKPPNGTGAQLRLEDQPSAARSSATDRCCASGAAACWAALARDFEDRFGRQLEPPGDFDTWPASPARKKGSVVVYPTGIPDGFSSRLSSSPLTCGVKMNFAQDHHSIPPGVLIIAKTSSTHASFRLSSMTPCACRVSTASKWGFSL